MVDILKEKTKPKLPLAISIGLLLMLPCPPQILEEATDFLVFSSEFNCLA